MLTIEEISSDERFSELNDEWNELLSGSLSSNIFLTWEWLYHWWRHYGNNCRLQILLVKDGSKLVGIAPLFLSRDKIRGTYQLQFLGSDYVGSDYLDFICIKGSESEILDALFDYFEGKGNAWQTIKLNGISSQSKSIELIHKAKRNKFYLLTKKLNACPYVLLPDKY